MIVIKKSKYFAEKFEHFLWVLVIKIFHGLLIHHNSHTMKKSGLLLFFWSMILISSCIVTRASQIEPNFELIVKFTPDSGDIQWEGTIFSIKDGKKIDNVSSSNTKKNILGGNYILMLQLEHDIEEFTGKRPFTFTIQEATKTILTIRIGKILEPTIEDGFDRPGADYRDFDLKEARPELCWTECMKESQCVAYTYVKPGVQGPSAKCWLKDRLTQKFHNNECISGLKPPKSLPYQVHMSFKLLNPKDVTPDSKEIAKEKISYNGF